MAWGLKAKLLRVLCGAMAESWGDSYGPEPRTGRLIPGGWICDTRGQHRGRGPALGPSEAGGKQQKRQGLGGVSPEGKEGSEGKREHPTQMRR